MEEQRLQKKKRKAERDNNTSLLISACIDLVEIYTKRGDYLHALNEYETIAAISKSEKKPIEYARANRGIGEAHMELNNFDKALEHHKLYLDLATEERDNVEIQRAHATIGRTYLHCYQFCPIDKEKNLNEAHKHFVKSLDIAENLVEISKIERVDMMVRLLSNLGLVKECQGDYDKALSLLQRSIKISTENNLYETLSLGHISIASVYDKKNDTHNSIQHLNLAIDAAKKVKSKVELLCNALQAKSDALIRLGDFHGAKQVLTKAYKLKTPKLEDRTNIERNLKIIASMCYTEDKLVTSTGDDKELKKLYEIMGDRACDLKNYSKGVEYYKSMLKHAEKCDIPNKELAACYYSLAETYKDNLEFDLAVEYYEKEYALCNELQDNLNTLSKIADTKEAAGATVEDVKAIYERAFKNCRDSENLKEEHRMVNRCIAYLKRNNLQSEAFKLKQKMVELESMGSFSDLSDVESEDSDQKELDIDIDLNKLTDDSEDSDVETEVRRKTKTFTLKKNVRGESQLHTACINGSLPVAKHLLEQGHPVNVRDNTGWLPLHEACNYGHYDIVKLLLDKGAAVNDRGGTLCNGITPLYDAANNGHLKIIELLLTRGALPTIKTDDGDTPLNILKEFHSKTPFLDEDFALYKNLIKKMSVVMERAGHSSSALKRINSNENYVEPSLVESDDNEVMYVGEYKKVINNLKRKSFESPRASQKFTKRPSLVEEMTEDWLDDDVKNVKKRKINPVENLLTTTGTRNKNRRSSDSPKKTPKRSQTSLIDAGFKTISRSFTEPDLTTSEPAKNRNTEVVKTTIELPKPAETLRKQDNSVMVYIDVKIEEKTFRVPILLAQVHTNTIGWLAEEAANKYSKKEGTKPKLELETTTGALLCDDDPLTLLFPLGALQAEPIVGKIVQISLPSLNERYKDLCQQLDISINTDLAQILEETSLNLNLENKMLLPTNLLPLCKALNHQTTLLELDLSGNYLNKDCIKFLSNSLTTLTNLLKLNLNCTGLNSSRLGEIVGALRINNDSKLKELSLSDNSLGNSSLKYLEDLTKCLMLESLVLSNCGFSDSFNLNMNVLKKFDVSDNPLTLEAISKILTGTEINLTELDISNCRFNSSITNLIELKILHLNRCDLTDTDIYKILSSNKNLQTINLNYNNNLTGTTLRRLIESDVEIINVMGCDDIFKYFEHYEECDLFVNKNVKTIKISTSVSWEYQMKILIEMFKNKFVDCYVEIDCNFLFLSSNK